MFLQGGQTALHKAAHQGHKDVVDTLINTYPDMVMKTTNVSDTKSASDASLRNYIVGTAL